MNFKNVIASAVAVGGMLTPDHVFALEGHEGVHVAVGAEASAHHAMVQGKYLHGVSPHLALGALVAGGADFQKIPLFGFEALAAFSGHISQRIGLVLEGTAGVELKKGHETEVEPAFKGALLGEYIFSPGVKVYVGPYAGKVGHDVQVGGTGGLIVDL